MNISRVISGFQVSLKKTTQAEIRRTLSAASATTSSPASSTSTFTGNLQETPHKNEKNILFNSTATNVKLLISPNSRLSAVDQQQTSPEIDDASQALIVSYFVIIWGDKSRNILIESTPENIGYIHIVVLAIIQNARTC